MDSGADKKLISLFFVFVISFVILTVFVVFNEPIATFTQAKDELVPSQEKSLIFAWPLDLEANGDDTSEITIFVRNIKGRGMSNKQIQLTATIGELQTSQKMTDGQGKAVFYLSSTQAGVAEIEALVDNVTIKKDVSVQFR
jgi:hypothetical protein